MESKSTNKRSDGLAKWIFGLLHRAPLQQPRLVVLERIILAPKQTLALVQVDGSQVLVATSLDGTPAFCPMHHHDPIPVVGFLG
jgi:hypothetical protein